MAKEIPELGIVEQWNPPFFSEFFSSWNLQQSEVWNLQWALKIKRQM